MDAVSQTSKQSYLHEPFSDNNSKCKIKLDNLTIHYFVLITLLVLEYYMDLAHVDYNLRVVCMRLHSTHHCWHQRFQGLAWKLDMCWRVTNILQKR